jgi:hypothetical protein
MMLEIMVQDGRFCKLKNICIFVSGILKDKRYAEVQRDALGYWLYDTKNKMVTFVTIFFFIL